MRCQQCRFLCPQLFELRLIVSLGSLSLLERLTLNLCLAHGNRLFALVQSLQLGLLLSKHIKRMRQHGHVRHDGLLVRLGSQQIANLQQLGNAEFLLRQRKRNGQVVCRSVGIKRRHVDDLRVLRVQQGIERHTVLK